MSEWTADDHRVSRRAMEAPIVSWLSHHNGELHSPEYVYDRCHIESQRFIDYVAQHWLWADLTPVYGFKFGEWNGQQVILQAHVAVRFKDIVLDWTARQFDPEAPVPKITTIEEFHAEWAPAPRRAS